MKIDSSILRDFIDRINVFISTINWRNTFIFLLFFVTSLIFWLILFSKRERVEGTYTIPIKYTNIPDDIAFTKKLPKTIKISLSDKGSYILKYDMKGRRDSLKIDVGDYKRQGFDIIHSDALFQLIAQFLNPTTRIISCAPPLISLESYKLQKKTLDVIFDGEVTTSESNIHVGDIQFNPDKIVAYGSKEALDSLESALTDRSVIDNIKRSTQKTIKLKKIDGIKFSCDKVEMSIFVIEYAENSFNIPIRALNVPDNINVKFFPSTAKVYFSAPLKDYKSIKPADFDIKLDYHNLSKIENGRTEIELTKSPLSIKNPRITPASVEFLFENK